MIANDGGIIELDFDKSIVQDYHLSSPESESVYSENSSDKSDWYQIYF